MLAFVEHLIYLYLLVSILVEAKRIRQLLSPPAGIREQVKKQDVGMGSLPYGHQPGEYHAPGERLDK
jgi:hypothetical protein